MTDPSTVPAEAVEMPSRKLIREVDRAVNQSERYREWLTDRLAGSEVWVQAVLMAGWPLITASIEQRLRASIADEIERHPAGRSADPADVPGGYGIALRDAAAIVRGVRTGETTL